MRPGRVVILLPNADDAFGVVEGVKLVDNVFPIRQAHRSTHTMANISRAFSK